MVRRLRRGLRPQHVREAARLIVQTDAQREAARLIVQADGARDAGRFREAAALYEEALVLTPGRPGLHIQAGHMFKESRAFEAAERHYAAAERLAPEDADLQLQLGHFNKTVDRRDRARAHYARAAALMPGWSEPERELAEFARRDAELDLSEAMEAGDVPVPELLPGPLVPPRPEQLDQIHFRRLGGRRWQVPSSGTVPLLSGIEAIQGRCFSDRALVEAIVLIDDEEIHRESIESFPTPEPLVLKSVFNLWVDLSKVPVGLHRIAVVLADEAGWTRRRTERVAIAAAALPAGTTAPFDSDGWVPPAPDDSGPVEDWVRALPSAVRPVSRMLMPPPASILVLRTDQLGDMVVSIPALRRLRVLFPDARIVGLVNAANADLARTLGLFDEVLVADFPDDPVRRRRTMTAEVQQALVARLAPYKFDVAIDLATSDVSRPLLRLTGARLTFGFIDGSAWLDGGISGSVRNSRSFTDASSQSGQILALVERLGALCATGAGIVRRPELGRERLSALGLGPEDSFVVLHAGARIIFSRWYGYPELARAWLDRHAGKVVLLTEGTDIAPGLPSDILGNDRLIVIDDRLAFDDLDALVSFATAFVGNDSGLKHLAALRGTPVVSIHSARIAWSEWGQEQTGVVVSRRVPCAGCVLYHDADECGKGIACIADITVAEVLAATEELLEG